MPQPSTTPKAVEMRAHRRSLVEAGQRQLLVALPCETVAYLDEIKKRQGLRNRDQVILQLIEQRRAAAQ